MLKLVGKNGAKGLERWFSVCSIGMSARVQIPGTYIKSEKAVQLATCDPSVWKVEMEDPQTKMTR